MDKLKGIIAAVFTATVMSTGPVCAKYALMRISAYETMFLSSLCAYITLSILIPLAGFNRLEPGHDASPEMVKNARRRMAIFFMVVQLLPGLVWFSVLPKIQAILAIMLKRTQPAVVLILSVLVGKRTFKPLETVLSLVAISGIYLIATGQSQGHTPADLHISYIFAACICVIVWATQFIYSREIFPPLTPIEGTRVGIGSYMVAILPVALIYGNTDISLLLDPKLTGAVLFMGVVVFGLGLAAMFYSLSVLDPWVVSMILLIGPVFGGVAAWFILNETITGLQIGGSLVVLVAMFLSILVTRAPKPQPDDTLSQ